MPRKAVSIILWLALAAAILLVAAPYLFRPPSLTGRWRDQSPAALLYEFRDDGSVWLIRNGQDLPVFRYAIARDVVEFHDGMGRPRTYRFSLDGDQLILHEPAGGAVAAEYRREP